MGPFRGKKRKELWRTEHLCLFWMVQTTRNRITFGNEVLSIQNLKSSSCIFLSENKLFIKDGPLTLVGFIVISMLLYNFSLTLLREGWCVCYCFFVSS